MKVLGDLVARDRRTDSIALRTATRAGSYSYAKWCTTSWKAGNLLRQYGVRSGATVAIATGDELRPPALVAFFGTALLGATATFEPDPDAGVEARAFVAPADRIDAYATAARTKTLAYGAEHDDPRVATFEREVWSENPVAPPDAVSPEADALIAGDDRFSHERLLAAARDVARGVGLGDTDAVVTRQPLENPGAVVAGILAPLAVGAVVKLDTATTGDVGVGRGVPESREIDPESVFR